MGLALLILKHISLSDQVEREDVVQTREITCILKELRSLMKDYQNGQSQVKNVKRFTTARKSLTTKAPGESQVDMFILKKIVSTCHRALRYVNDTKK